MIKNQSSEQEAGESQGPVESVRKNPKDQPVYSNLSEFIHAIYSGTKLNQKHKKVFQALEDDLGSDKKEALIQFALEKDKSLRLTLSLAEFVLDGPRNAPIRQKTMEFIESVVSRYSLLSKIGVNTVFQAWLDEGKEISDKLSFYSGKLKKLSETDPSGKTRKLTEKQTANILCIASIWLYFKRASDFTSLLKYLSDTAFDTKGARGEVVESNAFAYAASMITSTKKRKFSYLLKQVSDREAALSMELESKNSTIHILSDRLQSMGDKCQKFESEIRRLEGEISSFENEKDQLQKDINSHVEKAKHTDIHHNDNTVDLKAKLAKVLSGELLTIIDKALKANSKSKAEMVDYQLNDALEVINKELSWLKQ